MSEFRNYQQTTLATIDQWTETGDKWSETSLQWPETGSWNHSFIPAFTSSQNESKTVIVSTLDTVRIFSPSYLLKIKINL